MLDANKVRLAIAPIAWTNDDLPDLGAENTFEQCISEMALSRFTGSEIGNKYPKDVETLKQKLAIRGLQICNAWFSSTLLSESGSTSFRLTFFSISVVSPVISISVPPIQIVLSFCFRVSNASSVPAILTVSGTVVTLST